ncbi:polysaccharide deacetylase family protein [Cognatiluteimonas profundi]|uniref:polysaccharide deacetylase family protein n=1 Tax=Cognatiluteimonas profundi TaxID=2594501 RepID=UPI00131DA9A0|nr:polysaccharide deacetylase family protein [Lysobacter profundi]
MSNPASLDRPPRHPHAWIFFLLASQALAVVVWWRVGWVVGLPLLMASHLPFWWGTLWPRSRMFCPVLTQLPTTERAVWLTIDDGPSSQTLAMLDLLDRHSARATFFVVGERAAAHPELVHEIVRRGHGIGNHSTTHPSHWFWALPPWTMRREIERAQGILHDITGVRPRWFRAVVGMSNPFVANVLKDQRLTRVAWSARGFDAVVADVERVVRDVEAQLAPGAIVLMHEGAAHGRNLDAMALLLQRLDALGYRTLLPESLEVPVPAPLPAAVVQAEQA